MDKDTYCEGIQAGCQYKGSGRCDHCPDKQEDKNADIHSD